MQWVTKNYQRFATWARSIDADWSPHDVLVPAAVIVAVAATCWALGLRM